MSDPNNGSKKASTDKFPCPNCGGDMNFDIKSQKLLCPFCSHSIDIKSQEEGAIKEYDIDSAEEQANRNWGEQNRAIKCDSCGAETVMDSSTTADFCAFCGSAHVAQHEDESLIAPESVVPFKVTKDDAKESFKSWISKKFFAPSALKKAYSMSKIAGVYLPSWTYDSNTYSTYTGERGTYYYVTETRTETDENGETREVEEQVRKTRWEFTSGIYSRFFDDVIVNASKNVDEKLVNNIRPFKLGELQHYKPEFLSGFLAERYSINLKEGWEIAQEEIKSDIYDGIVDQINGDEVRGVRFSTSHNNVKFKHILLPVWLSSYKFKEKTYNFLVNGQTGKVAGYAPLSVAKIISAILIAAGVIGGIVALVNIFGNQ